MDILGRCCKQADAKERRIVRKRESLVTCV